MGVLSTLKKRRSSLRKDIKTAQAKARAEVKASEKDLARREKLLSKLEKQIIKSEEKGLKGKRKHERELAKTEYQKLKNGKFNKETVERYIKAGRVALPVMLPLLYRGVTQLRESATEAKARKAGVTRQQLAQFTGHGASLQARIQGIRNSLDGMSLPAGFKQDIDTRLDELRSATNNAEFMTAQQRRRAHGAINGDIDKVTAQIQDRLSRN
ncbi:DUF6474 family protein [Corynebacterium uterequi]|uniref:Uncharacterized protein n=1 Tax=Corynebacterium uterequi TaxID=1072256 RepID=A0A0G3HH82_9CORY|nr:DUF6474 family protein [Corynebacterium uterequi]AKK12110.1 hypothetical protein CUTER_10730 [Corynebacterium uterequi]